jgi:NADPH:quinone reductase-like Zn-dependent oxidoreductase
MQFLREDFMRAIVVRSFKSTPEIAAVPTPAPKEEEVLVQLSVAGINPFDWKIADGMLDGRVGHTFPLILGFDGAGSIVAVGSGVKRFAVGDKVFGQFWQVPLGRGTYTEYCAISENASIAIKPEHLSMADAAALPTAGMAALDLLEKSGLKTGATILIVGATGGVGQFLTQLAHQHGLRVIATGTKTDVAMLTALGASSVVDFTTGSVSKQVGEQNPDGIDGLMDLVSNPPAFAELAGLVRKGGVAFTTNYIADEKALAGSGIRGGNFTLGSSPGLLERLGATASAGNFRIPIEKRVPFDEAIAAIATSRSGPSRGKTVIVI